MSTKLQFTVVKAIDLPKAPVIGKPNYYVSVHVDSQAPWCTKEIKSENPIWNETVVLDVQESSTITVQIFRHTRVRSQSEMTGSIIFHGADCLKVGFQNTEHVRDLLLSTPSKTRNCPKIVISCIASSPDGATIVHPVQDLALLDDFVNKEHDIGHLTNPSGLDTGGAAIDAVDNITSSDSFSTVMDYLEKLVRIGDAVAEVHPYAKLAWGILTAAQKVIHAQQARDGKVRQLWDTVLDTLDFMKQTEPLKEIKGLEQTVQAIMKQIYDCTLFLRSYGERGFVVRTLRNTFSVKTDDALDQFTSAFIDLKARFHERMDIDSWKTTLTMKDGVIQLINTNDRLKEFAEDERLDNLPGAKLTGVQWDPDRVCLPGTRKQLLDEIMAWVHDPESERILWLSGGAGTGKSSVTNSVAQQLYLLGRLGASFRFSRDVTLPETPGHLFGNICRQLALFDVQLRNSVLSAIGRGCGSAQSLRMQARTMIVETAKDTEIVGPIVIVIDALDECGVDDVETEPKRETLVRAIVEEFPALPPSIKVLITSRDEGVISQLMPKCSSCSRKRIDDTLGTEEDISAFVQHRMGQIRDMFCLPEDWPGVAKERELAANAGGLFIWASVACAFIQNGDDPVVQLVELLSSSDERVAAEEKLDRLFLDVVRLSLPSDKGVRANNWNYVVACIVASMIPLTYPAIDSLLGLSPQQVGTVTLIDGRQIKLTTSYRIISSIRPILRIDLEIKGVVRLIHKSVFDFLTGRAEIPFRVDLPVQNNILAMRCLALMNQNLRYDICNIGDPSLMNSEVVGLRERIPECIPEALRYACRYFAAHLSGAPSPGLELQNELDNFIGQKLLYWVEAMSLQDQLHGAEECLQTLLDCFKEGDVEARTATQEIIRNAISLLRNCGRAIALSALHVYASALPLTPSTSKLYETYRPIFENIPTITSSHSTWTSSLRTMESHTDIVYSVVFSPDGTKLASTSQDKTVRLWDVESGTTIGPALDRHTSFVYSAVFSPDGTKLASASHDQTVRLWDVETGTAIGSALEGHTASVISVIFSPDGTKLASSSEDITIRLWDVETGSAIEPALQGHTSIIYSPTFSPDGQKLASASKDCTVRLWDVKTRTAIGSALEGHTGHVNMVTFSPDGTKLASASSDNTVWLWDVKTGKVIRSLEGHTLDVISVVFLPGGSKLASASYDETVRLWDVDTGNAIGSALEGTSWVDSLAVSPDGTKLASASRDQTVQLWDVGMGTAIGSALEGHTALIASVIFSPDGTKLASASYDSTVRLWDVEMGTTIKPALDGGYSVVSAAFSPNETMVAFAFDDSTIQLWDIETGSAIVPALRGHNSYAYSVAFSPDGQKLASASGDYTIRLWDVKTRTAIGSALEGHTFGVTSVAFSPDGTKLASGSLDKTLRLWDVQTGMAIGPAFECHTYSVRSVIFSPDGMKLASASLDGIVELWDTVTHVSLGVVQDCNDIYSAFDWQHETYAKNSGSYTSNSNIAALDESGFLQNSSGKRLVWIPKHLRGLVVASHSGTIAIGSINGAMTIIKNTCK